MIQAGDPATKSGSSKILPDSLNNYTIPAEFNASYFHKKGALAAARKGNNENPYMRSSGTQFYIVQGQNMTSEQCSQLETQHGKKLSSGHRQALINLGGAPSLDQEYTVFGEVTEGLDVIDKIAAVQVQKDKGDRPLKDVKMTIIIK